MTAANPLQITISLKSVYGVIRAYPECSKAKTFAALTGQKTLTGPALRLIHSGLGYTILAQGNVLGATQEGLCVVLSKEQLEELS